MSNDKRAVDTCIAVARCFKLWAKVSMMIVDGKRDATYVANRLQKILDFKSNWREKDGVIYFTITTNGMTGEGWNKRMNDHDDNFVVRLLRSPDFKPTNKVTIEVAVLKGKLFEHTFFTSDVHAEAIKRKLHKTEPELACLIAKEFTAEEIEAMGLQCIVAMHEPIDISLYNKVLLGVDRVGDELLLGVHRGMPDSECSIASGFAYEVSRTTTSTEA